MKKEDKDLLLRDLCARLPYGVICQRLKNAYELVDIDIKMGVVYLLRDETYIPYSISNGDEIKPYLRPMSSMTEEERKFIEDKFNAKIDCGNGCYIETYTSSEDGISEVYMEDVCELIKYLNSRHYDYRRIFDEKDRTWKTMIEMGIALPAPEGMYNK